MTKSLLDKMTGDLKILDNLFVSAPKVCMAKSSTRISRYTLREAIRSSTKISSQHLSPEIKLHLITPECSLWQSHPSQCRFSDPYWAFYWAGGQALSRYILDNKKLFEDQNIIDIGSGCGASSIAAAYCNAKSVIANDLDPVACEVISMNCSLNNVKVHINNSNFINQKLPSKTGVLFIGDMFYDSEFGDVLFNWLLNCKNNGIKILIGDPGRHALDIKKVKKMSLLKEFSLMSHSILENNGFKSSYVWEM